MMHQRHHTLPSTPTPSSVGGLTHTIPLCLQTRGCYASNMRCLARSCREIKGGRKSKETAMEHDQATNPGSQTRCTNAKRSRLCLSYPRSEKKQGGTGQSVQLLRETKSSLRGKGDDGNNEMKPNENAYKCIIDTTMRGQEYLLC